MIAHLREQERSHRFFVQGDSYPENRAKPQDDHSWLFSHVQHQAMESVSVYSVLESVNNKPRPFSVCTTSELWTDEYTSRFARLGAEVHGVNFSSRSIEHARQQAIQDSLDVNYVEADYLDFQPEGTFDLITMIMCDFCVSIG